MSRVPHLSRRTFLASAAAVGGALALGFDIPLAPRAVRASESRAEITVWIVIEPVPAWPASKLRTTTVVMSPASSSTMASSSVLPVSGEVSLSV